jgi:hypothetical protein
MRHDVSGLVRYERDVVVCLHLVAFYVFASPLLLICFLFSFFLLFFYCAFSFCRPVSTLVFLDSFITNRLFVHQKWSCWDPGRGQNTLSAAWRPSDGHLMTI